MEGELVVSIGRLTTDQSLSRRERALLAEAVAAELARPTERDPNRPSGREPLPVRVAAAIRHELRSRSGPASGATPCAGTQSGADS